MRSIKHHLLTSAVLFGMIAAFGAQPAPQQNPQAIEQPNPWSYL
ncbi:hypothetical protein [Herpetosiphon llansteffanensis]|nr:hypothetical protein [Herpetosiphon llansteffanensis]